MIYQKEHSTIIISQSAGYTIYSYVKKYKVEFPFPYCSHNTLKYTLLIQLLKCAF